MDLFVISVALLISFLLSELANHFKYPRVVGQILAGVLIGLPVVREMIDPSAINDIEFLAELGVIFLFLVIGMGINLDHLKQGKTNSIIIGLGGIIGSLVLGYAFGMIMDYSNFTSLVIGVCLAITSGSTNTQLFMEMGIDKKRLTKVIFGAALLDDLFAILFLTFLIAYLHNDIQDMATLPIKLIGFSAVIWALLRIMPYFITHIERDESSVAEISMMTVFGLLIAVLSIQTGLGETLGAFMAGVIIQIGARHKCTEVCGVDQKMHQREAKFFKRNIQNLETMTLSFIIPFFFVNMGLRLDLSKILSDPGVIVGILVVGVAGKFLPVILAQSWTKLTWPQSQIVGWGMNSRGMIELVIAEIALENNIIAPEVYAGLVVLVIITILWYPFVLRAILKKHPHAMELKKGV